MHDLFTATKIVKQALVSKIVDDEYFRGSSLHFPKIQSYEFGWVFHYGFLDSKGKRMLIAGNAPVIFEKNTGKIISTGTADPIESYINNYLETGNPHRQLGVRVQINNWQTGARAVPAIKAVQKLSNLGLAKAKLLIEDCLAGNSPTLETHSDDASEELVKTLAIYGFSALRIPE